MITPLVAAATVIPMRDRAGGPPELLMLRRSARMNFAGSAWAFPGGRVDAGDAERARTAANGDTLDPDEATARIAAIRETIEEAGLAPSLVPPPSASDAAKIRAGLAGGQDFATLLADTGHHLDLEALTPFARWIPFKGAPRRFDTRFYLAAMPDGAVAVADGTEVDAVRWITAEEALASAEAGVMSILFPTRCNLIRLARYRSVSEAVAASAELPVRPLTTFIEVRDGVRHICVPEGFGYPALTEAIPQSPG